MRPFTRIFEVLLECQGQATGEEVKKYIISLVVFIIRKAMDGMSRVENILTQ